MLHNNNFTGFGARRDSALLNDILHELGLAEGCVLCLDAGDAASYPGSGQTWFDVSGNGNHFFLGGGPGAEASDPTFNGTAGLPVEETYFSFDGGDYFTEAAAHTFADNWHKDNGVFSLIAVHYVIASASAQGLLSNVDNTTSQDGISFHVGASEDSRLIHALTNASIESVQIGIPVVTAWNFSGLSFNEAGPTCAGRVNATPSTPAVLGSTATDANSQPLRIGAWGDAALRLASGSRLSLMAGWSRAIGASAVGDLYGRLKVLRCPSLA